MRGEGEKKERQGNSWLILLLVAGRRRKVERGVGPWGEEGEQRGSVLWENWKSGCELKIWDQHEE